MIAYIKMIAVQAILNPRTRRLEKDRTPKSTKDSLNRLYFIQNAKDDLSWAIPRGNAGYRELSLRYTCAQKIREIEEKHEGLRKECLSANDNLFLSVHVKDAQRLLRILSESGVSVLDIRTTQRAKAKQSPAAQAELEKMYADKLTAKTYVNLKLKPAT
jgi:hypothetical protein